MSFRFSLANIHVILKPSTRGLKHLFCSLSQGQTLFAGKEHDRFFPIAYGEDIKSADADENEAR